MSQATNMTPFAVIAGPPVAPPPPSPTDSCAFAAAGASSADTTTKSVAISPEPYEPFRTHGRWFTSPSPERWGRGCDAPRWLFRRSMGRKSRITSAEWSGGRYWIRTSGLRLRRPTLYPTELSARRRRCVPRRDGSGKTEWRCCGARGRRRCRSGQKRRAEPPVVTERLLVPDQNCRPCRGGSSARQRQLETPAGAEGEHRRSEQEARERNGLHRRTRE